jgi:hypothetical protein
VLGGCSGRRKAHRIDELLAQGVCCVARFIVAAGARLRFRCARERALRDEWPQSQPRKRTTRLQKRR